MQNVPNKITDSDLLHALLLHHKHACEETLHAILECSDQQLRQDYMTSLETNLRHQQQISDLMTRKGYYRPLPASPQESQAAMAEVQKVLQASATPSPAQPGPMATGVNPRPGGIGLQQPR